jgi:hypothetical protein
MSCSCMRNLSLILVLVLVLIKLKIALLCFPPLLRILGGLRPAEATGDVGNHPTAPVVLSVDGVVVGPARLHGGYLERAAA